MSGRQWHTSRIYLLNTILITVDTVLGLHSKVIWGDRVLVAIYGHNNGVICHKSMMVLIFVLFSTQCGKFAFELSKLKALVLNLQHFLCVVVLEIFSRKEGFGELQTLH
jgi:hypothetical protein